MKQRKSNGTRITGIFFLVSILSTLLPAQEHPPLTIHLVYTGNLNCAIDDCRCGDDIVGGFTRIITILDSLRTRYPDLILVDAGDHFSSYSLPEANSVMAALLSQAKYTALNLGDQEFVESTDFLFKILRDSKGVLSHLSSNIFMDNKDRRLVDPFRILELGDIPIAILGIVDPEAFEFIVADSVIKIIPAEKALETQQSGINKDFGLQVLLFHGKAEKATKLIKKFPWIDVVVLSHNQRLRYDLKEETVFVECGADGEYIGHLQIKRKGNSWVFQNEFIPVHFRIPPESVAQQKVNDYYQRLKEIQKPGTTSKHQE